MGKHNRRWFAEHDAELRRLRAIRPHLRNADIARQMGFSAVTISQKITKLNLSRRLRGCAPGYRAREKAERDARIVADNKAGMDKDALAQKYGLCRMRIHQILKSYKDLGKIQQNEGNAR